MSGSVLDRVYDALNRHDAGAVASLVTDDVSIEDVPWDRRRTGRSAVEQHYREFFHAFPDARYTSSNRVEGGNVVVDEWLMQGTHTGELQIGKMIVRPSNRRIELRGVGLFELRGGRIAQLRLYYDRRAIADQLGIGDGLWQRASGQ